MLKIIVLLLLSIFIIYIFFNKYYFVINEPETFGLDDINDLFIQKQSVGSNTGNTGNNSGGWTSDDVQRLSKKCGDPGFNFIIEPRFYGDDCPDLKVLNDTGRRECNSTSGIEKLLNNNENTTSADKVFEDYDYTTRNYGGNISPFSPLSYDTVYNDIKSIGTKCKDLRSELKIPTNMVSTIFPDEYSKAFNKYRSNMHAYLYTTTTDETIDAIYDLQTNLIQEFDKDTSGGKYKDVYSK
jgi:hypothetical protein